MFRTRSGSDNLPDRPRRPPGWRRTWARIGIGAAFLAAAGLLQAAPVAARPGPAPAAAGTPVAAVMLVPWQLATEKPPSLAEGWEDVLLLEAMRAVRLSPAQLRRLLPLARRAETRVNKLREEEEATVARLAVVAAQNREALLAGTPGLANQQTAALETRRALEWRRAQAQEQVLRYVMPRLVKILTREQAQRVYLLTVGELPRDRDVVGSPALLDANAGFVMDGATRVQWREASIRQALAGRYPDAILAALSVRRAILEGRAVEMPGSGVGLTGIALPSGMGDLDAAALNQAALDTERLQARWDQMPQWITTEATSADLQQLLLPFARRMFLSPRLKSVLTERLDRLGGRPRPGTGKATGD